MEYEPTTTSSEKIQEYLDARGFISIEEALQQGGNIEDLKSLIGIEPFSMLEQAISLGGKVVEDNGL